MRSVQPYRPASAAWSRALGVLASAFLALQAAGAPLLTTETSTSCCCAHRTGERGCKCKVCTHAREVEANVPLLKTCGSAGHASVPVALDPVLPEVSAAGPTAAPRLPLDTPDPAAPPGPPREIPTPPPLARI